MLEVRRKISDAAAICGLAFILGGLVVFPSELVEASRSGLELCLTVMLPSLFPFFVVSSLSVRLGLADRLGGLLSPVMRPVFNVPGSGAAALALGFVGGYPVGARTVIALHASGRLTKTEAERMLAYSNNSGPAFILGVVGAGIFGAKTAGLTLYLVHALSSLAVGVVFRFWGRGEASPDAAAPPPQREKPLAAFLGSVGDGFSQCLSISAFVLFFTVLIRLLFLSGFAGAAAELITRLGVGRSEAESLVSGFIELTSGVWSLKDIEAELTERMALAAFMLGWAGISVHCQVLSFINDSGLSPKTYLLGKLLHGLLSALFIRLLDIANLI